MSYQRAAGGCEAVMNLSVELALEQPVEEKTGCIFESISVLV